MKETYKLELRFKTDEGKNKSITIGNPKAGLTEAEIAPAMQTIIDSDIFFKDGSDLYASARSARYVRTEVEEVYNTEEQ